MQVEVLFLALGFAFLSAVYRSGPGITLLGVASPGWVQQPGKEVLAEQGETLGGLD